MHRLTSVHIHNFRSCQQLPMQLAAYTPLVGYNNAGKSNILAAIRWVVAPFALAESDFCAPGQAVAVEAVISGITEAVLERLEPRHRSRIAPFISNTELKIRREQPSPGAAKNATLSVFDHSAAEAGWKPNPAGIPEAIKALFPEPIVIGAMEDAAEDAAKAKTTTTIGKLLAELTGPIETSQAEEVAGIVQQLRDRFDANGAQRADALRQFDEQATHLVNDFFPGVQIHLAIPVPDIGAMLKGGTIQISEAGGNVRDFDSLGHGAQRSIQMALVRYLADIRQGATGGQSAQRLLIIDEPELYLHPQAIEQLRLALYKLAANGYQVLFSTHSPMMIGRDAIGDTRLVRKTASGVTTVAPGVQQALQQCMADPKSQLSTLMELNNANGWLFADSVLLIEGKTERRLLPSWIEKATGKSLAARKTALVELQGVGAMAKCMSVLQALGIPARGVADLDFTLNNARALVEPHDHEPLLKAAKLQFETLAQTDPSVLLQDSLPRKPQGRETGIKPAQAVKRWAASAEGKHTAAALRALCHAKGVWVWPGGDIEHHFGLSSKDETTWFEFLNQLNSGESDWKTLVEDPDTCTAFLNWLDQSAV